MEKGIYFDMIKGLYIGIEGNRNRGSINISNFGINIDEN